MDRLGYCSSAPSVAVNRAAALLKSLQAPAAVQYKIWLIQVVQPIVAQLGVCQSSRRGTFGTGRTRRDLSRPQCWRLAHSFNTSTAAAAVRAFPMAMLSIYIIHVSVTIWKSHNGLQ